jgi:hypothetical protein
VTSEAQHEGVHQNMAVYDTNAHGKQCRSKVKYLKHDYLIDNNARNRSGHGGRPRPRVMEILDEILGTRPLTNPSGGRCCGC